MARRKRTSKELDELISSKGKFQKRFLKKEEDVAIIDHTSDPEWIASHQKQPTFRQRVEREDPHGYAEMIESDVKTYLASQLVQLNLSKEELKTSVDQAMSLIYGAFGSPFMTNNPSAWKSQALFSIERSVLDCVNNTQTSSVNGLANHFSNIIAKKQQEQIMAQAQQQPIPTPTPAPQPAPIPTTTPMAPPQQPMEHISIDPTPMKVEAVDAGQTAPINNEPVQDVTPKPASTPAPEPKASTGGGGAGNTIPPEPPKGGGDFGEEPTPQPKSPPPPVKEEMSTLKKGMYIAGGVIAVGAIGYGIYRLCKSDSDNKVAVATEAIKAAANASAMAAAAVADFG